MPGPDPATRPVTRRPGRSGGHHRSVLLSAAVHVLHPPPLRSACPLKLGLASSGHPITCSRGSSSAASTRDVTDDHGGQIPGTAARLMCRVRLDVSGTTTRRSGTPWLLRGRLYPANTALSALSARPGRHRSCSLINFLKFSRVNQAS
jgi:hypothetical protein